MATTRKKSSGRKKSTTTRKKTTSTGRKKSTATRKKTTRKKSTRKTTTRKKATRKYSRGAGEMVQEEMHEMHQGKLRSGGSGKKVTSREQAIAIGLSEARRSGEMVPAAPKQRGGKESGKKL